MEEGWFAPIMYAPIFRIPTLKISQKAWKLTFFIQFFAEIIDDAQNFLEVGIIPM